MITAQLLSPETLAVGWLIYVPVLLWAIARAPWVELFSDSRRQHLLFGTVFALFLLWLMRRDFDTGVSYHFLGMTAVTLLLDWPLAQMSEAPLLKIIEMRAVGDDWRVTAIPVPSASV